MMEIIDLLKRGYDPYCAVCDCTLTNRSFEMHHYPVPVRAGGTDIIPLCMACHDMIERVPLDKWSVNYVRNAHKEMNEQHSDIAKKLLLIDHWQREDLDTFQEYVHSNWDTFQRWTLLFLLKCVSTYWYIQSEEGED
jgi:hypothetical protein